MTDSLQTPQELAETMAAEAPAEALTAFTNWLKRRDDVSAQLATERLATSLDALASEMGVEARRGSRPESTGLELAAVVLVDTAGGVRSGDELAP